MWLVYHKQGTYKIDPHNMTFLFPSLIFSVYLLEAYCNLEIFKENLRKRNQLTHRNLFSIVNHVEFIIFQKQLRVQNCRKRKQLTLISISLLSIIIPSLVIIFVITNLTIKCPVVPSTGHFYFKTSS